MTLPDPPRLNPGEIVEIEGRSSREVRLLVRAITLVGALLAATVFHLLLVGPSPFTLADFAFTILLPAWLASLFAGTGKGGRFWLTNQRLITEDGSFVRYQDIRRTRVWLGTVSALGPRKVVMVEHIVQPHRLRDRIEAARRRAARG